MWLHNVKRKRCKICIINHEVKKLSAFKTRRKKQWKSYRLKGKRKRVKGGAEKNNVVNILNGPILAVSGRGRGVNGLRHKIFKPKLINIVIFRELPRRVCRNRALIPPRGNLIRLFQVFPVEIFTQKTTQATANVQGIDQWFFHDTTSISRWFSGKIVVTDQLEGF